MVKINPNSQVSFAAPKAADTTKEKDIKLFNQENETVDTQVSETEKTVKELFEPICKQFGISYNKEYIFSLIKKVNPKYSDEESTDTLSRIALCIRKAFDEHYDKKTKTLDLNNALKTAEIYDTAISSGKSIEDIKNSNEPKDIASVISSQYVKTNNGKKADLNNLSTEKKEQLIKEYFQSKLEEYRSNPATNKNADMLLLLDFKLLIKNVPDSEKSFLLKTAIEILKSEEAVKSLFESFSDNKKRMELADSLNFDYLRGINVNIIKEISTYSSPKGYIEYLRIINEKFKVFYDANQEIINRLCNGEEPRNENEIKIQTELNEYLGLYKGLTLGAACNKNMSAEQKEDAVKKLNDVVKKYPVYDKFVKSLAEYISLHQDSLDIPGNELKEFLNKVTDNKLSEAIKNVNEKSAIDTKTGMFKTTDAEIVALSEQKMNKNKQTITEMSIPQIQKTNEEIAEISPTETDIIDYKTITGNNGTDIIKDIFTGKIKISDYLEKTAIKQYKLMDAAIQGDMLLNASGKFFNDLVKNTKSSTLENLLAIGWKGKSYDATQKVKDEAEERKDDVA